MLFHEVMLETKAHATLYEEQLSFLPWRPEFGWVSQQDFPYFSLPSPSWMNAVASAESSSADP